MKLSEEYKIATLLTEGAAIATLAYVIAERLGSKQHNFFSDAVFLTVMAMIFYFAGEWIKKKEQQ